MKDKTPVGLTAAQWETLIADLSQNSSTVNDYRKILNLLNSTGTLNILTLTRKEAEDYFKMLDQRVEDGTLSVNTSHRYKATLRSLGGRMEEKQIVPGYVNPFHGLVRHEQRSRTVYTPESFASSDSIRRIREVLPKFSSQEGVLTEFLIDLGLTPKQITELKVCDFHMVDDVLTLKTASEFMEPTTKPWQESDLYLKGLPLTYVKSSRVNITWNYTGTYRFNEDMTRILKDRTPTLGQNSDDRLYFHTPRHLAYSYRAIHHLINEIAMRAGIGSEVTPMQMSLYGSICCHLQMQGIAIPDSKPIGCWNDRVPLPQEIQVKAVIDQLGSDFLKTAVGL